MNVQIGYENAGQALPPLTTLAEPFTLPGIVPNEPPQFKQRKGTVDTAAAATAFSSGLTCFLLGNWRNAVDEFQRSIKIAPSPQAYILLGHAFLNLQEPGRAAHNFEKTVKLSPRNVVAHLSLAIAYNHLGKPERAVKAARRATLVDPQNPDALFLLGYLHHQLHHWLEAERAYREAIKLSENFILAHQDLARLYYELGCQNVAEREKWFLQAIETYRGVTSVKSVAAAVYANIGYIYTQLAEREKASEAYQQAIKVAGDDVASLIELGTSLLNTERYAEARQVFSHALQRMGNRAKLRDISRAMLLTNYGVASMGLYASREAQAADAELLREAEESFRAALVLDPHYVHAQLNIGAAYYEQGRMEEAIAAFERVLRTDPANEQARNNLQTLLEQRLDERLLEGGLLKEIRAPITDLTPYQNRTLMKVRNKSLSETVIEGRR